MKLLKFFALTLISTLTMVAILVLSEFASIGANQILASAPIVGVWSELATSFMIILVIGSSYFLIVLTLALWLIWTIHIFREEIADGGRVLSRVRISVKKDDTL